MRLRGIWQEVTPYQKLVLFVFMIFLLAFVFTSISAFLINFFFNINVFSDPNSLSDLGNPDVISALKMMQVLSATGTFILPSLIAGFVFSTNTCQFLTLNNKPRGSFILSVIVIVLVSSPLINQMMVWNGQLSLPDFLHGIEQWMKNAEAKAGELTLVFLKMESFSDLMINLVMIALIPAVGEELIFRGVIQKLIKEMTKRTFFSILFTSILFSAMHLQFYGFLPRMALGILLGYLMEWSHTIWLPIAMHFLNNGVVVLLAYFYPEVKIDTLGTNPGETWQVILSALLTGITVFYLFNYSKHNQKKSLNLII